MPLPHFLRAAALESKGNLSRFIELRYYEMPKLFPHGVFSVAQATPDFFETALSHVMGAPMSGDDKDQSVYEMNYRRWIRQYREGK